MNRNKGLLMRTWALLSFLSLLFISASIQAATVRYQHTDMLGSVVAESDASGNIISRSQYEPFGKRLGGDKEGIGYTGHLQDKDLGLTYMQARYYDPLIGRFYANDPMGFKDVHNFNRYAYGNNNPYRYTDPDGKAADSWLNRPDGVSIQQHQDAHTGAAIIGAVVLTAVAAEVSPLVATSLVVMDTASVPTSDGSAGSPTNVSKYENITKSGSKLPNFKTDVPKSAFEKNLKDNGFSQSTSKDGRVNNFTKGDDRYSTRDYSKSTKGPAAEVFKKEEPVAKIRLGEED
ncbi:RHS repeat-associated core domain-containing protein [Shewanella cutis]|uniref:RHS repeat-associated core domain-containing protein n=1 Tax=Shewanella cutis TaxID=2766780 RepID=UPI001F037405|nr:RHS repeat-associated core domain-containing protein [Shewanella sp. PS-2]